NVRCRTGATTASGIIVNLPEGSTVTVRGPQEGSWYPVRCNGRDGYIHADYLAVTTTVATRQSLAMPDEAELEASVPSATTEPIPSDIGTPTNPPPATTPMPTETPEVVPTEAEPIIG